MIKVGPMPDLTIKENLIGSTTSSQWYWINSLHKRNMLWLLHAAVSPQIESQGQASLTSPFLVTVYLAVKLVGAIAQTCGVQLPKLVGAIAQTYGVQPPKNFLRLTKVF